MRAPAGRLPGGLTHGQGSLFPASAAWPARPSVQLVEQGEYPVADVVADGADGGEVEACGVGEVPVEVALAWVEGAGVAAAHGDHDVSRLHLAGGQGLGVLAG